MKFNDVNIEQRILEKTTDLIFRRGIKGWNMDQLSQEVGLAKNTLYKIISSKEILIEKIVIENIRSVQKQIESVIINEKNHLVALEKVVVLFPILLNKYCTSSMQEIFIEYPAIEKSVRSHKDEITKSVIDFIGKCIEEGIIRSDITKEFMFEMLQALVLYFIKSGTKGEDITKKLSVAFNCLMDGVRKI
ncbi:AcrR family transcriptional regulator [Clostridium tetanomorphum]|uniref:TetR/AcrR family transcriptional regulator n=1 Tax=Clostridium tetanomorphum TaxID=1553 RepID=A0A923E6N5_CLOTT|nr:TetR/AcrR family transcriptional regulator [Clostridium tetanomorphum]KAJ49113.1 TetR family transcriptional regulator [Clostridium tetanomorphum DSM 665]KAJ50239.1 TetR family transcriptional regulator [Clostridium tetanomorphum DSM 665]MBC2396202.1 TetR/AcrR family transcriptional regulator [Clostridium tetanomorphum]MBP1864379.1 AcrR family transcriptional regulator [Clostridium tetanomorphum]NRS83825.1 AcrR family transcriptional regulator [Clostridium tetanomorphum]